MTPSAREEARALLLELADLEEHLEADDMPVGRTAWGAHVTREAIRLLRALLEEGSRHEEEED